MNNSELIDRNKLVALVMLACGCCLFWTGVVYIICRCVLVIYAVMRLL